MSALNHGKLAPAVSPTVTSPARSGSNIWGMNLIARPVLSFLLSRKRRLRSRWGSRDSGTRESAGSRVRSEATADHKLVLSQRDFERFATVIPALRQAQARLRRASRTLAPHPGFPLSRE